MNNEEIKQLVLGTLTDEFQAKKVLLKFLKENEGIKPIEVNKTIKELDKEGMIDMFDDKAKRTVFIRLHQDDDEVPETVEVKELKRAPEARERRTVRITEEQAKELTLLTLRTPPVKEMNYPEGVTPEMYEDFKARILVEENKSILWDLVGNFNGAKGTAITMWEPENEKANDQGKVFYRWDDPENTWALMEQLCLVLDIYEDQNKTTAVEE